ncbi:MAG TPA: hypothetical protein VG965_02845 [Patescibacteria group bacterium]|nr:hypothetical protein [Patescibacteria group bacterium]
MRKKVIISLCILLAILIGFFVFANKKQNKTKTVIVPQDVARQSVQLPLDPSTTPSVGASKLPHFVYSLASDKFQNILNSTGDALNNLVETTITQVYANSEVAASIKTDKEKKELIVSPQDVANFQPGLYKISLKLRTIEGVVNIDQDFTWGVIAVNTNKSIYSPGEIAKIGIGVLNDSGETQCATGLNHVDNLSMEISSPDKSIQEFSLKNNTIQDSGKCGPITVTNSPDFKANFKTGGPGVYQMKISATVRGATRSIEDYFKVEESPVFDVEREDFPTRIYPRAMYPVTMSIIAKSDYSGKVEDIVPGNFRIDEISDNGNVVQDGSFQRIVWNLNLKAGTKKYISYFISFPRVSPEFYLIGPLKIGKFEEARQWQIASDAINSTSGVVTYEDNATQNTFYRLWSGTAYGTQGSISSGANTPTNSKWFREVSSPQTGEKLVAVLDSDTTDVYYVYRWTGSAWVQDLRFTITPTTLNTSEAFDIAYEELSGDALFAYSDGVNAQMLYRYYTSATHAWSAAQNAGTPHGVYKRWIRLRPQFGSDTILMGFQSNDQHVGAMVWDGSTNTFPASEQLDDTTSSTTATSGTRPVRSFEVAWETQSGNGLIFYGVATAKTIVYRKLTGGSWSSETTATSATTNAVAWLVAAADPSSSSNSIAIGTQDVTTPTCRMGIWNGSTLRMDGNTYPCRSVSVQRLIDVAFENTGDRAMWVINTSTAPAQMAWLTWKAATDFTPLTTETGSSGNLESVQLTSDLNTTSMELLYVDSAGALWDREWDGTSWSAKPGTSLYGNIQGTGETCEAYGFGFDRNLETQVAYKWFNNVNGDTGAGLSPLSTQDTSYTLTDAGEQFRLRMLLYYPDALLSTAQRQYKLQYVDPGTGTCSAPSGGTPATYTDVPSSGGSTISFASSGSLNSGDNIATNSADPSYQGKVVEYQDFQKSNNFTNSRTNMLGGQTSIWDFSLIDNTTFDRVAQTYCFRVARSNNLVLQIGIYPQINTAALNDVTVNGGTLIRGQTTVR